MGTQLPSPKGAQTPNFRPISIVAKRLDGSRWHLAWRVLGPGHILLDGDPATLPKEGGRALPQFSAHFYCRQTAGGIKMPLGMEVGLSPGDFVLDGDPAPPPKKGTEPPVLGPCVLWPNGWMHQDATWYGGSPQLKRLCVRWGPSSPSQKGDRAPQFLVHVYCGQMLGWMKTPLGTELDLGSGHIVLDGVRALAKGARTAPPSFRPMSIVATVAHLSYC